MSEIEATEIARRIEAMESMLQSVTGMGRSKLMDKSMVMMETGWSDTKALKVMREIGTLEGSTVITRKAFDKWVAKHTPPTYYNK